MPVSEKDKYIKKLEKEIESLKENLIRDYLTDAHTRRYLEEEIQDIFSLHKRRKNIDSKDCMVFVDVDKFKSVNDTYGHDAGDKALIFVAKTLDKNVRKDDIVCRFAGDEFVIWMRDTDKGFVQEKMNRISNIIEEKSVKDLGFRLSISHGAHAIDYSKTLEENISHADELMYAAKDNSKNVKDFIDHVKKYFKK